MRFLTAIKNSIRLPDELYVGFVDSLLIEVNGLILSGFATISAGIFAAAAARSPSLWLCVGAMLTILVVRIYFMLLHAKNLPSASADLARRRETIFLSGAVAYMGVLSTWTLVTFIVTDDGFARFLSASVTVPYAFGMWTRSFALDRGMNAQIAVAFIPLSAALFVAGGW